jgi:hypothetical protein
MSQEGFRELEERAAQHSTDTEQAKEADQPEQAVIPPSVAGSILSGPVAGAQRKALVQNVAQNFGNKSVQRMVNSIRRSASSGPEGGPLEDHLASKIQSERSNGQPMDSGVRREIEQSLGADLSPVRVHTGETSAELNAQMGAKAFTSGRDIFLGANASPSDKELLAHEATHTVQQGMSETAPSSIGAADTAHEHAAEHTASNLGSSGGSAQRATAEGDEIGMMRDVQREGEGAEQEEEEKADVARMVDASIQREGEGMEQEEEEKADIARMTDSSVQREGEGAEQEEEEKADVARMVDASVQREGEGAEQEEEEKADVAMMRDEAVQREGEEEE